MKTRLISLLIIGLLLSAGFGLAKMDHIDGRGHGVCPFQVVGMGDCLQLQNPIGFVASHLNAVSKFFSAIPVNGFAISLALLLVFVSIFFLTFNKKLKLPSFQLSVESHSREFFISSNKILFDSWFALHENSPAVL